MVKSFDRITFAVPDLPRAADDYQQLLGIQPQQDRRSETGAPAIWFVLPNTVIELVQHHDSDSVIAGLVFQTEQGNPDFGLVDNLLGLDIRLSAGAETGSQQADSDEVAPGGFSVDHIVLRTTSAQQCIELFAQQLGIRLALDRLEPKWGGRMLFFRAGKLTLEVIEPTRDKPLTDDFWGIAYGCAQLESKVEELRAAGVQVSEVRKGRKPGTVVATVKSHCLQIPTLLIGPGAG